MEARLLTSFDYEGWKADIYSADLPGEFKVAYRNAEGKTVEEAPLTGISTYHQRSREILDRLKALAEGAAPAKVPDRGDWGEY